MAKIVEIKENYIVVKENNITHNINIDIVKFEPRLNDHVSLLKDENNNVVNLFLINPEPVITRVIIPQQATEQALPIKKKDYPNASKIVGIYSIVFWLLIFFSTLPSLNDPSNFIEIFDEFQIDYYLLPVLVISLLVISAIMVICSIILLVFKNKKVKLISIIPLSSVYGLLMFSSLFSLLMNPFLGILLISMIIVPFINCIRFFNSY